MIRKCSRKIDLIEEGVRVAGRVRARQAVHAEVTVDTGPLPGTTVSSLKPSRSAASLCSTASKTLGAGGWRAEAYTPGPGCGQPENVFKINRVGLPFFCLEN